MEIETAFKKIFPEDNPFCLGGICLGEPLENIIEKRGIPQSEGDFHIYYSYKIQGVHLLNYYIVHRDQQVRAIRLFYLFNRNKDTDLGKFESLKTRVLSSLKEKYGLPLKKRNSRKKASEYRWDLKDFDPSIQFFLMDYYEKRPTHEERVIKLVLRSF